MLIRDDGSTNRSPNAVAVAPPLTALAPAASRGAADDADRRVQIDGLRALAMLGVLYVHFWNDHPLTEHLRVSLFFVVSGFLITHILYRAKMQGGTINVPNFYVRRALRLFPALFVMIIVGVVFNADDMQDSFGWHALQLSNIYFVITHAVKPWVTGHLWSLNVLEQFYLLAPLIVLLLPRAGVHLAFIGLLVLGVFLRVNAAQLGVDPFSSFFLFAFDPIAAGALAYLLTLNAEVARIMRSGPALLISIAVLASPLYMWEGFGSSESYRLLMQPAICAIVVGAFHGYGGLVGASLQSAPARFLSKISYGVYMYHLMVWWLVVQTYPELFHKNFTTFVVLSGLTIIAATISWYLIEDPIARLKRFFPTRGPSR